MPPIRILVVNPGSTSTKLALFVDGECEHSKDLTHETSALAGFARVADQEEFRAGLVAEFMPETGGLENLSAVVGRGGLLRPVPGGTYRVTAKMLEELRFATCGEHASNLGALIADRIARRADCPAFIVDPVVVDELAPEARLTGVPGVERRSIFHALSQKAAARKACAELNLDYDQARIVVAHLGGGISVGAHRNGRVVEVSNALDGEGPMAPERAGALPARAVMGLCFRGDHTRRELENLLAGRGGLTAHLGTNSLLEIERRLDDPHTGEVFAAFTYGIARAITAAFAALMGAPEAVVLTGGGSRCDPLVAGIRERMEFAAPLLVYPENLEMTALAEGALRVIRDGEEPLEY